MTSQLDEDRSLVKWVDERCRNLTSWEADFMESCVRRVEAGRALSDKQRETLGLIYEQRGVE